MGACAFVKMVYNGYNYNKYNLEYSMRDKNKKQAFTLAEMMVVLLVLSLVTAAFLPVITKRSRVSMGSDIWKYVSGAVPGANSDIYYGSGTTQGAAIGAMHMSATDNSRLLINTNISGSQSHILFQKNTATVGRLNLDGLNNISLVNGSILVNPTGDHNIAIGDQALQYNEIGNSNIAIGQSALGGTSSILNCSQNIAIGVQSLSNHRSGGNNVAMGYNTMSGSQTGENNVAIGAGALLISSADKNVAIGFDALSHNTAASNTAVGSEALANNTIATGNTAVGSRALTENQTGASNTAVGASALVSNAASSNTAVGFNALNVNTTGGNNTALGNLAMSNVGTGSSNVAIGSQAFQGPVGSLGGDYNVAVGQESLYKSSGNDCIAIGYQALYENTTGKNSVAIGTKALAASNSSTARENVAVGYTALNSNTVGANNTAIGAMAGASISGSGNTCLGASSNVSAGLSNATAIGYSAVATASNTIMLGKAATPPTVYIPGQLSVGTLTTGGSALFINAGILSSSDRRLKNVGASFISGLDQLRKLTVYNYTFKKDKTKTQRVGVMAQDLQKVFPGAVTKGEKGYLMIRQEDMFYAMLNSIKQLDIIVQNVIREIKTLGARINDIDNKIVALMRVNQFNTQRIITLEKQNKRLEARLAKLEKKPTK